MYDSTRRRQISSIIFPPVLLFNIPERTDCSYSVPPKPKIFPVMMNRNRILSLRKCMCRFPGVLRDGQKDCCGLEGEDCSCNGDAKFGVDNNWSCWYGGMTGSFKCEVKKFGQDPVPGSIKKCVCRSPGKLGPGKVNCPPVLPILRKAPVLKKVIFIFHEGRWRRETCSGRCAWETCASLCSNAQENVL